MIHDRKVIQQWLDDIANEGWNLTKWEESFIESVTDQFNKTGTVSERQEEIIERIYTEKVK